MIIFKSLPRNTKNQYKYKNYRNILKRQYQNLVYTVKDETVDGDKAKVTVEIEVYDLYKITNEADKYYTTSPDEFKDETGNVSQTKYIDYRISKLKEAKDKVKVLLAQSLFGNPDILLLDEPTNDLDIKSIEWLQEFLINFENTVIVVSHDRYFLNKVCTHIADVDFGKIKIYPGNYDFWYESSQLALKQAKEQNKKKEEKIKELQEFIARFSANASKSKQATSRKKSLEKIELEEIKASNRKYPYIDFKVDRLPGNEILKVKNISKTIDGEKILDNISFNVRPGNKIAVISDNELRTTILFQIIAGELEPDEGEIEWGQTITNDYFPKDNNYLLTTHLLYLLVRDFLF